ncbi:MAG: anthrone oxygenase family protein [Steroidobacteraceae bacterium]
MASATPANLFRRLAPATQILVAVSIALNWPDQRARWSLIGALIALVLVDVITFTYHYPRNRQMFTAPLTIAPEQLARVARQWASANWVRVALILGAWLGTLTALMHPVA